ncbi:MAG: hypothetical protein M1812_005686 [Candelaria pacifica]|nr:MAG: hypothetical protein M1812_005686 [Candelaria pacifica]
MSTTENPGQQATDPPASNVMAVNPIAPSKEPENKARKWRNIFGSGSANRDSTSSAGDFKNEKIRLEKWSMGVLNDTETDEVPGSVLLMSSTNRNEPLGLRSQPARTSQSSLPSPYPLPSPRTPKEEKKRTADGEIILEPQPDESLNDPLNWPAWRRDTSLLCLGFYCMIGGGMTPVLAAGFTDVATTYNVSIPQVALTTGLYMMGLGLGSVVASPTAILYGKRPVYLVGLILFILSSVWCALSPNYPSLVIARIVMGFAVSPVECLPSATIAEIFFLHERAYRVGVYTLLLLGGKNLVPLVSAAIIQGLGWRWVFWIVTIIVGVCLVLLFLFVPETFWDRTPRPKPRRPALAARTISSIFKYGHDDHQKPSQTHDKEGSETIAQRRQRKIAHVGFADPERDHANPVSSDTKEGKPVDLPDLNISLGRPVNQGKHTEPSLSISPAEGWNNQLGDYPPQTPNLHNFNSPYYLEVANKETDYLTAMHLIELSQPLDPSVDIAPTQDISNEDKTATLPHDIKSEEEGRVYPHIAEETPVSGHKPVRYTTHLKTQPPKTFRQNLRPWNGRLCHDNWFRVAVRPFILFAYPAVLWSTVVYSLSIGWLIVLSESVATIYREKDTYNFSALGTGLVYLSPFIGGVLGTAVAGKVSDIIVRFMSRRNGGLYEPEFRLVMAIPITISTTIGLMGFGWSAAEHDKWIVPTIFFGIISFGCSLGSTTAITFCVDSYRQYAGEALVTLNFSKNIFHGLVFSLFFNRWLEAKGSKSVFLAIGGIQLACLLFTVPMFVFGKRARMWTVRKNLMEKF